MRTFRAFAEGGSQEFRSPYEGMTPEDRREANRLFGRIMRVMPSSPRQRELKRRYAALMVKHKKWDAEAVRKYLGEDSPSHQSRDCIVNESIGNILYLVRGLPGSGKSTHAKTLVDASAHFEADQYFYKRGKYDFDPTKLKAAHADCLARTRRAMAGGRHRAVAVSNTFTMRWEMQPYIDLAEELGWTVRVIRMTGNYGSIHGVPSEAVERMRGRFEPVAGEAMR